MSQLKQLMKTADLKIFSYKHDGTIHRIWTKYKLYKTSETLTLATAKKGSPVFESSGKRWHTREDTIVYFYHNEWYNVVVMNKTDGLHYYVNIASPALIDEEGIKYIDYDLDIKVLPSKKSRVLDRKDFAEASCKYNYSEKLKNITLSQIDKVKTMIKTAITPFNDQENIKIFNKM